MNLLLQNFTSPEWTLVLRTLLHTLWQGGLVALALAFVLRHCAHPVVRYRLSLAALAGIMLMGLVTWAVLDQRETKSAIAPLPTASLDLKPTSAEAMGDRNKTEVASTPIALKAARQVPSPWTAWLALSWLVGAAAMLFRAAAQFAGVERLRRSCRPLKDSAIDGLVQEARRAIHLSRRIQIAVTDQLTSPAVVGILVPTLILPLSLISTLSQEQIRFILLHELAHIRRGDYLANLFQLFAEALLFFNPSVWWISHEIRREREACCDALAIEFSGAPGEYARTLLHVAENALNPTAAAAAFGGNNESSSLDDRVQRLLVPGYRPVLRLTWRATLTAMFVGIALLILSAAGARVTIAAIAPATGKVDPAQTTAVVSNTVPPGRVIFTSPRRQAIMSKLTNIRLEYLSFTNEPFGNVVRYLSQRVKQLDPQKQGVNFIIDPGSVEPSTPFIDPATGLIRTNAPVTGLDRNSLLITIQPGFTNILLADALDAIVRAADKPIRYSVADFGIVFSPKAPGPEMHFRAFKVSRIAIPRKLEKLTSYSKIDSLQDYQSAFVEFLASKGMDFRGTSGQTVLCNTNEGSILLRATDKDLDAAEKLIQELNTFSEVKIDGSGEIYLNKKKTSLTEFSRECARLEQEGACVVLFVDAPNGGPSPVAKEVMRKLKEAGVPTVAVPKEN